MAASSSGAVDAWVSDGVVRTAPATVGQRLVWQLERHRGEHGALNCPVLLRLRGELDGDALHAALVGLRRRHEALRTTFDGKAHRLVQVVNASADLALPVTDVSHAADVEAELRASVLAEVREQTDPAICSMRARLWRLAPEEHLLGVTLHHLVTDGWSCALVARDLGWLYAHLLGCAPPPSRVAMQYVDWAAWHEVQLKGPSFPRLQRYWRNQLAGARVPALGVLSDDARTAGTSRIHSALVSSDVVAALEAYARERRTSLFAAGLASLYWVLRTRYSMEDIAVASIFANRPRQEMQATVGFLSNMVVLRGQLRDVRSFEDVFAVAAATSRGAFANQAMPYQMLPLDTLDPESPRPDSFVFQLFAGPMARASVGGLVVEPVLAPPEGLGARWRFELALVPSESGITVLLTHDVSAYDQGWASEFLCAYVDVLSAVAEGAQFANRY